MKLSLESAIGLIWPELVAATKQQALGVVIGLHAHGDSGSLK